jgi:glutathione S-transferase
MLLYNSPVSGNCYKVRLLLAQRGIDYERRDLDVFDRSDRPDVLGGLNPSLRVPTVVLDDGRPLGESGAILFHFAQSSEYLPADAFQRAQVLQWMFFEQYDVERTSPSSGSGRWPASTRRKPSSRPSERQGRALAALERHLGRHDFLVADRYSIADIALFGYTHVAPEGGFELVPYPAVREWLTRVAAQPGHIAITD